MEAGFEHGTKAYNKKKFMKIKTNVYSILRKHNIQNKHFLIHFNSLINQNGT